MDLENKLAPLVDQSGIPVTLERATLDLSKPDRILLPLDRNERICLVKQGALYRYVFCRIPASMWEGFFSRIDAEMEQASGTVTRTISAEAATLWLFHAAIMRAEGWKISDGRNLMDLPNWKERIPPRHQMAAAEKLMRVSAVLQAEGTLDAEGERVELKAFWSAIGEGMMEYQGLVHRFATPNSDQRRRFLRARSRTVVVGGSRAGKTLISSTQPLLAKLYDELIQSVEGYGVAGRALGGRDEIVREMDTFHKVLAARELFETRLADEDEAAA